MGKFKLNWGWSILLVYITFMTIFLFYFWRSFQELETNEMVTEDYYNKELGYGSVLAKKKNADTMRIPVQIIQEDKDVKIIFPAYAKNIKGKIILYKPNNSKLDNELTIELDSLNEQIIDKKYLIPGRWDVKLDWKDNKIPYFTEKKITIR
jgi:hypothetical protein